jgi:hypothetical protein
MCGGDEGGGNGGRPATKRHKKKNKSGAFRLERAAKCR